MTDYAKIAQVVQDVLQSAGMDMVMRQRFPGAYDPAVGTASNTLVDNPGIGVKLDYSQKDIDGTNIRQGDQQVYLAVIRRDGSAMPLPRTGDQVVIGTEVWGVVIAKEINPAGTPVLFMAQVRK